jgi:hypothetical protein
MFSMLWGFGEMVRKRRERVVKKIPHAIRETRWEDGV